MGTKYYYTCTTCGRTDQWAAGRWCWSCYQAVIGERRRAPRPTQAAKESLIRLYQVRAARGEPLFG